MPLRASLSCLLLVAAWSMAFHGQAQSGFTRLVEGSSAQEGMGVHGAPSGFVATLRTYKGPAQGHRAELLNLDPSGVVTQRTDLDLLSRTFLQRSMSAGNGDLWLVGSRLVPGAGHIPLWARCSTTGQVLGHWTPGNGTQGLLMDVAPAADGGVVACGIAVVNERHATLVLRANASGELLWMDVQPFDLDAEALAVAILPNAIMVTGRQVNFGGTSDALFMRYTLDGDLVWTTSWGGIADEEGRALIADPQGHVIMAGTTRSEGPVDGNGQRRANLHLIAIDLNGDTLWTRTHGDLVGDRRITSVHRAANGDLLVTGALVRMGNQRGREDGWVARLGAQGTLLWQRSYDPGEQDILHHLGPLPDGFVACGSSMGPGRRKALLLRRNALGE